MAMPHTLLLETVFDSAASVSGQLGMEMKGLCMSRGTELIGIVGVSPGTGYRIRAPLKNTGVSWTEGVARARSLSPQGNMASDTP